MNAYLWIIVPAALMLLVVFMRRDKGAVSFLEKNPQTSMLGQKKPRKRLRARPYTPSEAVLSFVRGNMNILAIKQVREETGLGPRNAKGIVDALMAGIPSLAAWDGQVSDHVRGLYAKGEKIEAIKVLRAESGLGLREAKDRVESL